MTVRQHGHVLLSDSLPSRRDTLGYIGQVSRVGGTAVESTLVHLYAVRACVVSLLVERVRGLPQCLPPPSPAWFSVVTVLSSAQANGLRAQSQARRRRAEPVHT